MLDQRELREQLKFTLNGGNATGWNDDEPAVMEAACELTARRYFGPDHDVRAVTAFVSQIYPAFEDEPRMDQLKI
jgi:hypothetical protein